MARKQGETTGDVGRAANVEDRVVQADPDKLFFISMLVKDIELVPAVLDLVDNSVDGARSMLLDNGLGVGTNVAVRDSDRPFEGMAVTIRASPERFEIKDNCGGIDLDVALRYAFRFGRPKEYGGVPGSVGEFGVGMKRALFKLGTKFEVTSRAPTTSFELTVDVDEWANEAGPEWTFELDSAERGLKPPKAEEIGTTIRVTRLHDTVSEDFDNPLVLGQLREQLRLRHQGAIQRGLTVTLNGDRLTGLRPQLLSGPDFQPVNRSFVLNEPDGNVAVQVVAGIAAGDGKGDIAVDEGQAEKFRTVGDAGWWFFCNDRLLLFADRTALTGWGTAAASYHPQYRRFRGYVYLTASNTALLPWNTTKTGVDQDSRVWRQVQSVMKTALVEVQAVLNRLKTEREDADSSDAAPFTAAMAAARPVTIAELYPSENVVAPPAPQRRRIRNTTQKVQYSVERERYEQVAEALKATTTADVGRLTFDYFYEREIDS